MKGIPVVPQVRETEEASFSYLPQGGANNQEQLGNSSNRKTNFEIKMALGWEGGGVTQDSVC